MDFALKLIAIISLCTLSVTPAFLFLDVAISFDAAETLRTCSDDI